MIKFFSSSRGRMAWFFAAVLLGAMIVCAPGLSGTVYAVDDEDCPEDVSTGSTSSYGGQLYKAHQEYDKAAIAATQKTFREMKYKDNSSCVLNIMSKFQNIYSILMGILNPIVSAILAIINQVLTFICNAIVTAINNLLASICLPVPNLSLPSFSLPSLQSESCSGVSLGSFVSVTGGYSSFPGMLPFNPINNMSLMGSRTRPTTTIPVF